MENKNFEKWPPVSLCDWNKGCLQTRLTQLRDSIEDYLTKNKKCESTDFWVAGPNEMGTIMITIIVKKPEGKFTVGSIYTLDSACDTMDYINKLIKIMNEAEEC